MPVWLNVAPVKVVVDRWHVSQEAVVGTWVAGLPRAMVPLWQFAHGVAATTVWFIVAGRQPVVRWQLSQEMAVLVPPLWLAGIPVDVTP